MNIAGHMENLERKRAVLQSLIELETSRPLPDFIKVTHMKRKKMHIKEQLSKLSTQAA